MLSYRGCDKLLWPTILKGLSTDILFDNDGMGDFMVLKKLMLFLVVMSVVAVPCMAQVPGDSNVMYLSNGEDPWDTCTWVYTGETRSFNLVLYSPYNHDSSGNSYVEHISGFECRFLKEGDVHIMGLQYPVAALNLGTTYNLIVGYDEPVLVTGPATVLATINFVLVGGTTAKASPMCTSPTASFLLSPTERPSLEGFMAYVDADDEDGDPLVAAVTYPNENYQDYQVMMRVVGTDVESWGGIKALYR